MLHPPKYFHGWGPENPNQTSRLNESFAGDPDDTRILELTNSLSTLLQEAWFDGNGIEKKSVIECQKRNFVSGLNLDGDNQFFILGHSVAPSQFGWVFKRYVRISRNQSGGAANSDQMYVSVFFPGYSGALNNQKPPQPHESGAMVDLDIVGFDEVPEGHLWINFGLVLPETTEGAKDTVLKVVKRMGEKGYRRIRPCKPPNVRRKRDGEYNAFAARFHLCLQPTVGESAENWNPEIHDGLKILSKIAREIWTDSEISDDKGTDTSTGVDSTSDLLNQFLDINPQVILAGPPGTSKTYSVTQEFLKDANRFTEIVDDQFEQNTQYWDIVQFHPQYGYEDFVMGIEAKTNADGNLGFEPRKGIFLNMAIKAKQNPQSQFYLVIDEINRGVMGRIFGELILTLEYRELSVHLPGLDEPLEVPKNLFLIGTMNTADRNIALIDHALRRRFMVMKMLPETSQLENYHATKILTDSSLQQLSKQAFNIVQSVFKNEDGEYLDDKNGYNMEDYAVGHTYFMADSEVKLKMKIEHQVLPLLGEYMREGVINRIDYENVKSRLEQKLGL